MRRFAAHFAFLPSGFVGNPLVTVSDDGRIVEIGRFDPSALDSMCGVEFHSGVLAPAFANAHTHLELSYLKGAIPEGCGFAGFAAAMAAVRNRFSAEERLQAAVEADRAMFEAGTAVAGDISNDDSAFGVKADSRIGYRTFGEVFGLKRNNFDTMRGLASLHRGVSLTPHSLYSLNDGLLKRLCSEGEGPLSIHFMESPAERELFAGRGPLREWFDREGFAPDFLHYGSPAERLAACVPADRTLLLVHNTCVTQRDIDIIMNHFRAPVHWCLCPRSNAFISGLRPDVGLLRRNGLRICLGTDSLASNTTLSIAAEMASLREVPASELLRWATAGGAEALGAGEGAGRLEEGSRCGLVAVSGVNAAADRIEESLQVTRLV